MNRKVFKTVALALACVMLLGFGGMVLADVYDIGKTTANVNRRATPSTSGAKKGTLSKGTEINIVGTYTDGDTYGSSRVKGDWYELDTGDFVSADYVEIIGSAGEEEAPSDEEIPAMRTAMSRSGRATTT